jgi:hypothetical protein
MIQIRKEDIDRNIEVINFIKQSTHMVVKTGKKFMTFKMGNLRRSSE